MNSEHIAHNLETVRRELHKACIDAGRAPKDVALLAVSKTHPAQFIQQAYQAQQRCFGESYAQELASKAAELAALGDIDFHFIGHLQSNKARMVAAHASWIHSVHSLKLLETLSAESVRTGRTLQVLFEVHLSPEESKSGCSPDLLPQLVEAALELPGVEPRGLMTMPPWDDDPEVARPYFRKLRELRDKLRDAYAIESFEQLSMGMSHDFKVAVQEGSTIVRVGTAIFGNRNYD